MQWSWRTFDELGTRELHDVLALRQQVFVVEQACPYPDIDGRDDRALHLLGRTAADPDRLAAYLRLFPPDDRKREASIGRVVVHPELRGHGLGRSLMRQGIDRVAAKYGSRGPVRVEAQAHLEAFYRSLGFHTESAPYDLDGIPHIQMLRRVDGG